MEQNTPVTLPTATMLCGTPRPLTDYARLLGARCVYTTNMVNQTLVATYGDRSYNFGEVWLRTRGDNDHEMQTATWRTDACQMVDRELGFGRATTVATRVHSRNVFSQDAAVLPCFTVGVDGVGVNTVNGEDLLTLDGKAVSCPENFVDAATRKLLNKAFAADDATLRAVGSFARPIRYDYQQKDYQVPVDVCYNFQGKNYVRVADGKGNYEWLHCATIKVTREADGLLLPKQTLLAGSFDSPEEYFAANYLVNQGDELDVKQYALGKYLNTTLMNNLRESTRFVTAPSREPRYRIGRIDHHEREL